MAIPRTNPDWQALHNLVSVHGTQQVTSTVENMNYWQPCESCGAMYDADEDGGDNMCATCLAASEEEEEQELEEQELEEQELEREREREEMGEDMEGGDSDGYTAVCEICHSEFTAYEGEIQCERCMFPEPEVYREIEGGNDRT